MEKPFFDVFPTLELNTELKNLFAVYKSHASCPDESQRFSESLSFQ